MRSRQRLRTTRCGIGRLAEIHYVYRLFTVIKRAKSNPTTSSPWAPQSPESTSRPIRTPPLFPGP